MKAPIRASIYEILAGSMLKEPNVQLMQSLQLLCKKTSQNMNPRKKLTKVLQELPKKKTTQQDYYDLFVYPLSGRYIPPYESAMVEGKEINGLYRFGPMNGETTKKVEEIYSFFQFEPAQLNMFDPLKRLPLADHLGYELAFMSYLCYQESILKHGKESIVEWQKYFLTNHLLPFIHKMRPYVKKSENKFYGAVLEIGQLLIEKDLA